MVSSRRSIWSAGSAPDKDESASGHGRSSGERRKRLGRVTAAGGRAGATHKVVSSSAAGQAHPDRVGLTRFKLAWLSA